MITSNDIIKLKKEFTDLNGKCLIGQIDLDDLIKTLELKERFEKKTCDLEVLEKALENGVWYYDSIKQIRRTLLVNLVVLTGNRYSLIAGLTKLDPLDYKKTWALNKEDLEVLNDVK